MLSDACSPDPCQNGKCKSKSNGYECKCNRGYTGKNCQKKGKKKFRFTDRFVWSM